MKFYSNIRNSELKMHRFCVEKSGLICFEYDEAYDIHGNKLKNTTAIYIPKDLNQKEAKKKYVEIRKNICSKFEEYLITLGIQKEKLMHIVTYPGCEQEYFPELIEKIKFNISDFL